MTWTLPLDETLMENTRGTNLIWKMKGSFIGTNLVICEVGLRIRVATFFQHRERLNIEKIS